MDINVMIALGTLLKNSSVKRVNANLSCYRWEIKKFSNFTREVRQSIISPVFMAIDSKVKWFLKMYPNSRVQEESEYVLLAVYCYSEINVKACVELSFINLDNEISKMTKLRKELKLIADSSSKKFVRMGDYIRLAKRKDIEDPNNRILADDCLTISFDITFHDPIVKLSILSEKDNLKDIRLQEFDDFGKLLDNDRFSDVKFVVGDKEIHVHKAILASRSPVFDAMFQHEMQEKKTNIVEIVDIEYAVLMELFRYMYTGIVTNIEVVAYDLLVAAEKYCVERLKSLCEKSLLSNLKVDNAIKCFRTADCCNAIVLKKKTLEFIVNHGSRVVEREDFDMLPPYLMSEITRAMARKLKSTH